MCKKIDFGQIVYVSGRWYIAAHLIVSTPMENQVDFTEENR